MTRVAGRSAACGKTPQNWSGGAFLTIIMSAAVKALVKIGLQRRAQEPLHSNQSFVAAWRLPAPWPTLWSLVACAGEMPPWASDDRGLSGTAWPDSMTNCVRVGTQHRRRADCRLAQAHALPQTRRWHPLEHPASRSGWRRSKKPNSGPEPYPTRAAHGPGICRGHHPGLPSPRHHHTVCRLGHRHRRMFTDCHKVRTWLAQQPRYHMHHTPTYSSWLNQVEGWFGLITSSAPFAVVRSPAFKTWRGKSDAFGQHYKCSSRLSLDGYCRFHPVDRSTLSAYFRHAD